MKDRSFAAAAISRIVDADYATEITEFTRAGIVRSAGLAMLAQANLIPRQILSLLLPTDKETRTHAPSAA